MSEAIPPPNRIPWPPILFVSAIVAALALGAAQPGPDWMRRPLPTALGWAVLLGGIGLDLAAMAAMKHQRANILPHRAATALVTTGPFAWSRNPIYLGNVIAMSGAGLLSPTPGSRPPRWRRRSP
jgi:protein-S-isoprenylcysteine O-methyltransferase Ste14